MIDESTLPKHYKGIYLGASRKAAGGRWTESERRTIIAKYCRVDADSIELPEPPDKPPFHSGIGDRLEAIVKREVGNIPCGPCKEEIRRLNTMTAEEVLAEKDELADRMIERANQLKWHDWRRWVAKFAKGIVKPDVLAWIDEACGPIAAAASGPLDCTVIIKSFNRHLSLWRLVYSIRHFYPTIPIVIADDSFEDLNTWTDALKAVSETPGVTLVRLPHDSGIARGRNAAVQAAATNRIILCDDDFIFTKETKIENLLTIMDAGGYDIVGGVVRMDGTTPQNWTGRLSLSGEKPNRTVHLKPLQNHATTLAGLPVQESDITLNFFAASRQKLLETPWDTRYLITEEHLDSFMEWKEAGLKVAWTQSCVIGHWQTSPLNYKAFRSRKDGFPQLNRKWGVNRRDLVRRHNIAGLPKLRTVEAFEEIMSHEMKRPPIVVMGTGRCGTTIATQMLMKLGWQCPLVDEFGEHPEVIDINERWIRHQVWDDHRSKRLMTTQIPPWILKDPRFALTLDKWKVLFADSKPLLLWITRDIDATIKSLRAKKWGKVREDGQWELRGLTIPETHAKCQSHFDQWPWAKIQIPYEQLSSAIRLFDVSRGQ